MVSAPQLPGLGPLTEMTRQPGGEPSAVITWHNAFKHTRQVGRRRLQCQLVKRSQQRHLSRVLESRVAEVTEAVFERLDGASCGAGGHLGRMHGGWAAACGVWGSWKWGVCLCKHEGWLRLRHTAAHT